MKYRIGFIISVLLILCILTTGCGQTSAGVESGISLRTVRFCFIKQLLSESPQGSSGIQEYNYSAGTGFIVNNDGYVITANHLLEMGKQFVQQSPADNKKVLIFVPSPPDRSDKFPQIRATMVNDFAVIAQDEKHDLALLKINLTGQNAPILFQTIHGFVFPQGTPMTLSFGNASLSLNISKGAAIAATGYSTAGQGTLTGNVTSGELTNVNNFVLTDATGLAVSSLSIPYSISDYYQTDIISNTLFSGSPVYSPQNGAIMGMCINIPNSSGKTAVIPGKYILDLLKSNGVSIK